MSSAPIPEEDDPISQVDQAEITRAMRAILRTPLLLPEDHRREADLRLVRKHAVPLAQWLGHNTGWRLIVEPGFARLARSGDGPEAPRHPARDSGGTPFGRRRYVLTMLLLAEFERSEDQVTLQRLSERLIAAAADPRLTAAGMEFSLAGRAERSDVVAAIRLLVSIGVLRLVEGDEEGFVAERAEADALYDIDRRVLAELLTARRGPSMIDAADTEGRLAALTAEYGPDIEAERNSRIRRRLYRRLLADPVVYYDNLSVEEREYLVRQRGFIIRRIEEATGLVAEVRAEGIAMTDPEDELTDVRMPSRGGPAHATLLLAGELAKHQRAHTEDEIIDLIRRFQVEHRHHWGRNATEPAFAPALAARALADLEALCLIRSTSSPQGSVFTAQPAISRFALGEVDDSPAQRSKPSARMKKPPARHAPSRTRKAR